MDSKFKEYVRKDGLLVRLWKNLHVVSLVAYTDTGEPKDSWDGRMAEMPSRFLPKEVVQEKQVSA